MKTASWLARSVAVGTLAVAIVGCSSSSKSSSSSSSSSSAASSSSGSGNSSGSSGGNLTSRVNAIATKINAAKNSTYKAVYTSNAAGQTQTITIEQAPPNSLFSTGDSTIVTKGSTTYACQKGAGCTTLPAGTPSPSAAVAEAFSPETALTAIQAAANEPGVNVDTETFAGQSSTCISVSNAGATAKYCVTDGGILASESAAGNSFTLTSFTTNVPSSDFDTAAGPAIPSAP